MPIEKISRMTLDDLAAARMQFEKAAGVILAVETVLKAEGQSEVWVFRVSSLDKATDRARAFTNELERSLHALVAKKPLGPDDQKKGRARPTKKKPSK